MGNRVYVSGKVKDELVFKQIRDVLWIRIDAREYYKKANPHLTLIPQFSVKDEDLDEVKSIINSKNFEGEELNVKTLSVYENIHEPYVVQLDIGHSMRDKIESLIDELSEYSKTTIKDPASLHITLFKTKGWWDDIPKDVKVRIQQEIMMNRFRDTELSGTEIDIS